MIGDRNGRKFQRFAQCELHQRRRRKRRRRTKEEKNEIPNKVFLKDVHEETC